MITFIGSACWDKTAVVEKESGDVKRVRERYESLGGNATNAALMAVALRAKTGLVTAVGADQTGIKVMRELDKTEIKTFYLPASKTKSADIVIYPDCSRDIIVDGGVLVNSKIKPEVLGLIQKSNIIDFYPGSLRKNFSEWYQASSGKIKAISGTHIEEEIKERREWDVITESSELIEKPEDGTLLKLGVKIFVLTRGDKGGEWWAPGLGWEKYRAISPIKSGDSTGAGDAFRAGLLTGISRGLSNEDSVLLAARCGAAAASVKGSFSESLDRFSKLFNE